MYLSLVTASPRRACAARVTVLGSCQSVITRHLKSDTNGFMYCIYSNVLTQSLAVICVGGEDGTGGEGGSTDKKYDSSPDFVIKSGD